MPLPLRQLLRDATAAAHERLHHHSGFAAIQNGTIDLAHYRALLIRLHGFYLPFEAAVDMPCDRSTWLQADLAALNGEDYALDNIPQCTFLARFDTQARQLGARYVVEGSSLGGRHLARSLEPLVGFLGTEGRRFFLGRGADTTAAWHVFLARLAAAASTPAVRNEIVESAVSTFSVFEEWLRDWSDFSA